jgi:DNA-binding response OmpR family regulator
MLKRILIIEDNRILRETIIEILSSEGFEAIGAEDGRDGLKKSLQNHFDLIITDILMPNTDGIEVIVELIKTKNPPKIIAISGGGFISAPDYLNIARTLGCNATLTKPFENDELVAKCKAILGT